MKKSIIFLFLVLTSVYFVSADSTTVNIQTFSNHDVMVSAIQPGSLYDLIESIHGTSDAEGKFSGTLEINNTDSIDLKVWIKKDNEVIVLKRFDDYAVGTIINLEAYPDSYVKPVTVDTSTTNVTNVTPEVNISNQITTSNNSSASPQPGLTGFSTSENTNKGFFSSQSLYFFIGLIAIVGIFFLGVLFLKKRGSRYEPREETHGPNVRKLSDFLEERKHRMNENYGASLQDAEKKLKEAQAEINRLKNSGKIEEAKRKLVADEKELMRLRRGE
ncbi:MAG: hypothetical protein AABW63_03705 [Nanoarchaeota archaeon]|mgnify:CR=1 FL=1